MNQLRISVFYDGAYVARGNRYFRYQEKRGWISFSGLHAFLERYIASAEKVPEDTTRIVEAHWYDGRVSAAASHGDGQLEKERDFELSLIDAGIVPHYLPIREILRNEADPGAGYALQQKGIDVNIALDCVDLAHADRYDVAVLFTGDEDFVPIARRITALGKRVLICHFEIPEGVWADTGKPYRGSYVSSKLKKAASHALSLNQIVSDPHGDRGAAGLLHASGGHDGAGARGPKPRALARAREVRTSAGPQPSPPLSRACHRRCFGGTLGGRTSANVAVVAGSVGADGRSASLS